VDGQDINFFGSCILVVKDCVEDLYMGHLTKLTHLNLIGIGLGPHSNKMVVEYPPVIEPYTDKIKSCN
jgi:hypothetical protein